MNQHRLYLIRHAESALNLRLSVVGGRSNETPLTAHGEQQARNLGNYLLSQDIQPNEVHSSPAVRTLETARISLEAMGITLPITQDDRLQEMSQGVFEGASRKETYDEEVLAEIARLQKDFKFDGGESMNDVGLRKYGWLSEWAAQHEGGDPTTALVYTHGMGIRCLVGHLRQWNHPTILKASTPNTSITLLTGNTEGWDIEYFARNPQKPSSMAVS